MSFEPQPFGKYYLLERIALGGMAEIYKAKTFGAVGFEKLLAIKRILPHMSQNHEFINMLVDEAKIAVQLSHMNVVQVYDLGKIEDDYFIAMEFIDGKDLRSIMKQCQESKTKISVENAVFIVVEICKGLDYAHRKKDQFGIPLGIVHRDISPQNILISFEGEVKIVDFGIAKATKKVSETEAGVLKGKFAYMSPEQARGLEVDRRTDIFSTGIILAELLTGERLFFGENNIQTLEKIRNFHIQPPFLPAEIPSELEFILMQALHNDPEMRYQTANEFQVDLTKFLYSSALDFTSKNLSELMSRLFATDIKQHSGKKSDDDQIELDTETRHMIAEANQEVLVSREEENTPAEFAARLASEKKKKRARAQAKVPTPDELFAEPRGQRWLGKALKAIGLFLLLLGVLVFRDEILSTLHAWNPFGGKTSSSTAPDVPRLVNESRSVISIETEPAGARVFIDGVEHTELTPTLIKNLPPRKDMEVLVSLQDYQNVRKKIRSEPGEVLQIKFKLERHRGTLVVSSKPPDADIYLNGKAFGKTPFDFKDIDANIDIALLIRKEGYEDFTEIVRIDPSGMKIIQADLKSKVSPVGSAYVVSVPPGAQLTLNGVELQGKTPMRLNEISLNRVNSLVLKLDGYLDHTTNFRLANSKTEEIKVYLKTKPEIIR